MFDIVSSVSGGINSVGNSLVSTVNKYFGANSFLICILMGIAISVLAIGLGSKFLPPPTAVTTTAEVGMSFAVVCLITFVLYGVGYYIGGKTDMDLKPVTFAIGGSLIGLLFSAISIGLGNASQKSVAVAGIAAVPPADVVANVAEKFGIPNVFRKRHPASHFIIEKKYAH